jgi:hypothetical protein
MNKFAVVVSRVFDPVIEIPLLLVGASYYALTNGLRWRFLVFLLVVDALFPLLYILWGRATKRISDWDMTKRSERTGIYVFTVIVHFTGVIYALMLGKTMMAGVLFVFWSMAVVFALVTMKWKISVHAGVNAAVVAFFNHWLGWSNYWWLVLVLVLVLWSRVEMKKHTPLQVMVGAAVALVWVEMGLRLVVGV